MSQVFINTLAINQKYAMPIDQSKVIQELSGAGFQNIEIRREYITDFTAEIEKIAQCVKQCNVNLYYSIPDLLFNDQKINQNKIANYFDEAQRLGSKTVKLAVGDYEALGEEDISFLKQMEAKNIALYVENDQTKENGTVQKILKFLKDAEKNQLSVKATFDVGNWIWAGEDPKENAAQLKEYVRYVHFKDVKKVEGGFAPAPLGKGCLDWAYFKNLFAGIPFGIEYPCSEDPIPVLKEEVKKLTQI